MSDVTQRQLRGNQPADIWHSAIVSEEVLVRLVLAQRTSCAELRTLTDMGINIDSEKLIPDLAPIIIDMMGCPDVPGLRENLEYDLERGDLSDESARAFLRKARTLIAEGIVLEGAR